MNDDLKKAVEMLQCGEYTCVLCKGDMVYTSRERGVRPLLDWFDNGMDLMGYSAADKIVGKAAALLYVVLGVKSVYADVMSIAAFDTLKSHGIETVFSEKVNVIINRSNTGPCPMEQAVAQIDEPLQAVSAIKEKLAQLKSNAQ